MNYRDISKGHLFGESRIWTYVAVRRQIYSLMQLTALPSPQNSFSISTPLEGADNDNGSLYENEIKNQENFYLFSHFFEKMVVFVFALNLETYF